MQNQYWNLDWPQEGCSCLIYFFRTLAPQKKINENYIISSDSHPDTLLCHSFWHIIWKYTWYNLPVRLHWHDNPFQSQHVIIWICQVGQHVQHFIFQCPFGSGRISLGALSQHRHDTRATRKTNLRLDCYFVRASSRNFRHSILTFCSGILSGINSAILSGIYWIDIFSGILSDILSAIFSGIYSGMLSGICSRILSGILSDILLCHSIWHLLWHSLWHVLRSGSAHWDLVLALRSGSAHWDLALLFEVPQCPLSSAPLCYCLLSGEKWTQSECAVHRTFSSFKVGRVGDESMFVTLAFRTLLLPVPFWISSRHGLAGQAVVTQP